MNHPALRNALHDYVDGLLTPARTREVEGHLEDCAACHAEVSSLRAMLARAAELAEGVEPARDLWPALRARAAAADRDGSSTPERPAIDSRFGTGFRAALAAAAAVALFWSGTRLAPPSGNADLSSGPTASRTVMPPASPLSTMLDQMILGLERETRGTGMALAGGHRGQNRAEGFDAETARGIDRGLEELDQAIRESLDGLRADPENAQLLKRVAVYYRLRLDLLHRAAGLSRNA